MQGKALDPNIYSMFQSHKSNFLSSNQTPENSKILNRIKKKKKKSEAKKKIKEREKEIVFKNFLMIQTNPSKTTLKTQHWIHKYKDIEKKKKPT